MLVPPVAFRLVRPARPSPCANIRKKQREKKNFSSPERNTKTKRAKIPKRPERQALPVSSSLREFLLPHPFPFFSFGRARRFYFSSLSYFLDIQPLVIPLFFFLSSLVRARPPCCACFLTRLLVVIFVSCMRRRCSLHRLLPRARRRDRAGERACAATPPWPLLLSCAAPTSFLPFPGLPNSSDFLTIGTSPMLVFLFAIFGAAFLSCESVSR